MSCLGCLKASRFIPPAKGAGSNARPTLVQQITRLLSQLSAFDYGDVAPTSAMLAAYKSTCNDLAKSAATWRALNDAELSTLNAALVAGGKIPLVKAAGCRRRPVGRSTGVMVG